MSNKFEFNGKQVSSLSYILKSCVWNTSMGYTLIKVLEHLHKADLMEKISEDYDKLEDVDKHYMKTFYDSMVRLNSVLPFSGNEKLYIQEIERNMFPTTHVRLDNISNHIHQTNYEILKKHNLVGEYLRDFGGTFKGILVNIHSIPNSDFLILETKEQTANKFYSSNDVFMCWGSFEKCLIFSMFPEHHQTVQALRELEKNNVVKIG